MPPAELPASKRWLALAVLCVTVLVANLDSTVLNVALPTLVRDLNATSGDLQWIVDSYIVVFAGSLLAAGSLADRIGRKKTLLAGLAVFAGGSAWAAFSGDVFLRRRRHLDRRPGEHGHRRRADDPVDAVDH